MTCETDRDVNQFLSAVMNEQQRIDCHELCDLMSEVTGYLPKIWGDSMVGFGKYHYRYASGHEGDSFIVGFAPRAGKISLYLSCELSAYQDIIQDLGKVSQGKGCIYINKLSKIDSEALRKLIRLAAQDKPRGCS